jgi:hypothetical protein
LVKDISVARNRNRFDLFKPQKELIGRILESSNEDKGDLKSRSLLKLAHSALRELLIHSFSPLCSVT